MRFRRLLILGLAGINIALMAAMTILSYELPPAFAQRATGGGKYVTVTATYTGGTDALYVLQAQKGLLVAFTPHQGGNQFGQLAIADTRDVKADLGTRN